MPGKVLPPHRDATMPTHRSKIPPGPARTSQALLLKEVKFRTGALKITQGKESRLRTERAAGLVYANSRLAASYLQMHLGISTSWRAIQVKTMLAKENRHELA